MFSQDRKYFRFSFSRGLVLAFLLISPTQFTQGTGMPASSGKAATTSSDTTNPKFVNNLVDCVNEFTKVKNWKTAGQLIHKLPELMEKALPVAKGLVLLYAYLLYRSFDQAMNLAKWDYKKHKDKFKALEEEMKPVRELMESQLIPQWKKGNYTQKSAENLLQRLNHTSTAVAELVQAIHRDGKNGASDKRRSVVYGVGAVAVCAGSVFVSNIPVMVVICGVSGGTAAFSVDSYYSLDDTLTKLDTLWEDTTKMSEETVKYRAQLDIAKMRGEFEM